jgi:hypothetical protein
MADLSHSETRTVFEDQKRIIGQLRERLEEKEQQVIEGESLRKKLHNTILVSCFCWKIIFTSYQLFGIIVQFYSIIYVCIYMYIGIKRKYPRVLPCPTFATWWWSCCRYGCFVPVVNRCSWPGCWISTEWYIHKLLFSLLCCPQCWICFM